MGLNCKCPTSFLNDQTREFPIIILGIYTVSKTRYILSEAPGCKEDKDFDRLMPWNVDGDALMRMRNLRDSGKPDPARTEPYIFRGIHK